MADMKSRAEVVKAMEIIARCVNCEDYFWNMWAMSGVADGDINRDTPIEEIAEMGYCEDDEFKELMTLFLKLMWRASQNGGLYDDGITSGERVVEWR